jgi:hypothetical protein
MRACLKLAILATVFLAFGAAVIPPRRCGRLFGRGLLAYGICQSGCNAVAVACYGAAGYTFGTVTAGVGVPAVIASCNAALGICMAACVAAGLTPVP